MHMTRTGIQQKVPVPSTLYNSLRLRWSLLVGRSYVGLSTSTDGPYVARNHRLLANPTHIGYQPFWYIYPPCIQKGLYAWVGQHVQQMSCTFGILQGQYLLGHLIGLPAVVQAQKHLKIAVHLFYLDKNWWIKTQLGFFNVFLMKYLRISPTLYQNTCWRWYELQSQKAPEVFVGILVYVSL